MGSFNLLQSSVEFGSGTATFTGTVGAGNILLVYWGGFGTAAGGHIGPDPSANSVTDNLGNLYKCYSISPVTNSAETQIWVAAPSATGSCTVTAVALGGPSVGEPTIILAEYSCANGYQICSVASQAIQPAGGTATNLPAGCSMLDQGNLQCKSRFMESIQGDTGQLQIILSGVLPTHTSHVVSVALLNQFKDVQFVMGDFDGHTTHTWSATGFINGTVSGGRVIQFSVNTTDATTGVLADMNAPYVRGYQPPPPCGANRWY